MVGNSESFDGALVLGGRYALPTPCLEPLHYLQSHETGRFCPIDKDLLFNLAFIHVLKSSDSSKSIIDMHEQKAQQSLKGVENPQHIRALLTEGRLRLSHLVGGFPFFGGPSHSYARAVSSLIKSNGGSVSTFGLGNIVDTDDGKTFLLGLQSNRFLSPDSGLNFELKSPSYYQDSRRKLFEMGEMGEPEVSDLNDLELDSTMVESDNKDVENLLIENTSAHALEQVRNLISKCLKQVASSNKSAEITISPEQAENFGFANVTDDLEGQFRLTQEIDKESYSGTNIEKFFSIEKATEIILIKESGAQKSN